MSPNGLLVRILAAGIRLLANLPVLRPRMALGCGVIGLVTARRSARLGQLASNLLRVLEYRGYDSTGGVFQDGDTITLLKAPGAPSEICEKLGMPAHAGNLFCGQVRWATYGAVDELNAQPHEVSCHSHIYGAHNGNISNSPELKRWLLDRGHRVLSDNDGEMLVHLVEHLYHEEIERGETEQNLAMRRAIVEAARRLEGSYAAIIVLPETGISYAIKAGSSLYAGLGTLEDDGGENPFFLASSDLTAVLGQTRQLVPLRRGQFVEYTARSYRVFAFEDLELKEDGKETRLIKAGEEMDVPSRLSRLRVDDIKLREPFRYFMEQEIADEVESSRRLVRYLAKGSPRLQAYHQAGFAGRRVLAGAEDLLGSITAAESPVSVVAACERLFADDALWEMCTELPPGVFESDEFYSDAGAVLAWAWEQSVSNERRNLLKLVDLYHETDEINQLTTQIYRFVEDAKKSVEQGGSLIAICSGTSYNAAKTAAIFFNDLAGVKFMPLLPGEYRGQLNHSFSSRDLLITISQSGETKDVIDVVDDIMRNCPAVKHYCIVNNMNSTLAQEKAHEALPLRCGPEIAVPATKSFINQLTLLYGMALYLAAALGGRKRDGESSFRTILDRRERLEQIPGMLQQALESTAEKVEEAAGLLYQAPSIHILATRMWGVAREGALKVREVVLNHAEGIEATEFKHGPNTILGLNTGFGLDQVKDYTRAVGEQLSRDFAASGPSMSTAEVCRWLENLSARLFGNGGMGLHPACPPGQGCAPLSTVSHDSGGHGAFDSLYRDYPLVYITGPGSRDVELTISQINTHKIRGAMTIVIAEPDARLEAAALDAPMGHRDYKGVFIPLPESGDLLITTFTSIMVLQRLALRMCEQKLELLDSLGVREHGVHPDAPKNVSKSITVD
jgi:glucosamine--fructose-6-phosphate aminotransferase (isomerizing)